MKSFIFVVASLATAGAASAITTYSGLDAGVGPGGPWPTTAAAAGLWDADAAVYAPIYRQDYESLAFGAGNVGNLDVTVAGGPVVSASQTFPDGDYAGVRNDGFWGGGEVFLGFNTTAGGSKYYQQCGPFNGENTTKFVFRTPVQGFGTVITGLQRFGGDLTVSVNNGEFFDVIVGSGPSTAEGGGALFWGVLGLEISSITFTIPNNAGDGTRDLFAFDDSRWVVPTPGAAGLFGLGALVMTRRRR